LIFANPAPQPRQQVWSEGEAVRIVKAAWRAGYRGLAACLATAWDSQLPPVDASRLQRARHAAVRDADAARHRRRTKLRGQANRMGTKVSRTGPERITGRR